MVKQTGTFLIVKQHIRKFSYCKLNSFKFANSGVLTFLLDNVYILIGSKLYRQIVDIPMDTNCAPLVADLLLFILSLLEDTSLKLLRLSILLLSG